VRIDWESLEGVAAVGVGPPTHLDRVDGRFAHVEIDDIDAGDAARYLELYRVFVARPDRAEKAIGQLIAQGAPLERIRPRIPDLIERGELLGCLEAERITIDNPPPWAAEVAELRGGVERGWAAYIHGRLAVIEDWLRANAPGAHAALRPPASEQALAALQAAMPSGTVLLPSALRALYRWHDGMDLASCESFLFNLSLLPVSDAIEIHELLGRLLAEGHFDDHDSGWWRPEWLPLLYRGNGDLWVVDLRPESGQQVGEFIHDDGHRPVYFVDVDDLIDGHAADLADGVFVADPEQGIQPRDHRQWDERRMSAIDLRRRLD
jgi:cell wall assembly regulator SMI1